MKISVGITNTALTKLDHDGLVVEASAPVTISKTKVAQLLTKTDEKGGLDVFLKQCPAKNNWRFAAKDGRLTVSGSYSTQLEKGWALVIRGFHETANFSLLSISRQHAKGSSSPVYQGVLQVYAWENTVRCNLVCDLESYVRGVLQSEVPESYHLEAIKAQAVAARTYGLHPRVDHLSDYCNVCDSYLCCQYFAGGNLKLSGKYLQAIDLTKNEVLTSNDLPILALFSSCAGGHTENYENCFSNQSDNAFPGERLEYLRGVSEGGLAQFSAKIGSEQWLRELWQASRVDTCDAWSTQFRWKVDLSADLLESQMHYVVAEELINDSQYAPFIVPPKSNRFGHILSFKVVKRGVSGVGMSLEIQTSTGIWTVNKELVIRSIFKNTETGLKRLKSAKVFFEQRDNHLGLLEHVTIFGLGWGHGVGLQQTGAQGLALAGKNYREILQHYFTSVKIDNSQC